MRRTLPALVAAGALALSGCEFEGAYDLPLPGSPVDEEDAYQVTAEFNDVLNVVPRSTVMVDDFVVGVVIVVDGVGWHARVPLNVRDDVELPLDTSAAVVSSGLLGGKYLQLVPGGDIEYLEPGGEVTFTQSAVNLEDLIGQAIFSQGGGG